MSLRQVVRTALAEHAPGAKDYPRGVKVCLCGHEVPIGDLVARTRHLEDAIVEAIEASRRTAG